MRTLSILQPYADAIINGNKRCENRDWYMGYRGLLLIHTGKGKSELSQPEDAKRFVFGALLGTVEVVDCLKVDAYIAKYGEDPWGCFGDYCTRMVNPRPLSKPIPWRGQLGIFDVPDEVIAHAL